MNSLYFLETFSLNLSYMPFAFIISYNSSG